MKNEEILKKAFAIAEEEINGECMADVDEMLDITVSETVRERIISNLMTYNLQFKKSNKAFLKALLVAAIIILTASLTVFAVKPLRNFVIEKFFDGSRIIFTQIKGNDSLYPNYGYIPDGYILCDELKTKNGQTLDYKNGNAHIIIDSFSNKNSVTYIDTENAETGDVKIGNVTGYYSIKNESIILAWSTGKYNHTITADKSTVINSIDDVVKIAQSLY